MNHFDYVKEESPGSRSLYREEALKGTPQPMEGLHGQIPPPFLNKTYDLVDDSSTDHIVSWGRGNNSFVVWDSQLFSLKLLPSYFKHGNFSSFVRQLNTYGFRKVDSENWEFANEGFIRGKRHLLKKIRRRKTTISQSQFENQDSDPCVEMGRFGVDMEMDKLRRDKQVLMGELVRLREEQQNTRAYLKAMEKRIEGTEKKHQQLMSFLVRTVQNPKLIQHLIQQKDGRKQVEEAVCNKRRRPIEHGDFGNIEFGELGHGDDQRNGFVNKIVENYGEVLEAEDTELDRLAMEIQRSRGGTNNLEKRKEERNFNREGGAGGFDQRFWEDIMKVGFEEKFGSSGFEKMLPQRLAG